MEGYIKFYSEKKGYGFIKTEEYGDVYVHKSGIKEFGHFGLQKGDPVSFEVKETSTGKQAINLQPLKIF
ncbi:MAG TPA: cold shock domain-containing protein [Desulfobacterales bacterium]|jgi:CspA family cold shock protein|nr:cold shock domain-containing protein [Desulfobacterales bacterium]